MDIELAYTVNGEKSNIFPKKGSLYKGENVECEGKVTAKWDNEDWGLVNIENPDNEKIKCKVDFEITAVDYIKELDESSEDLKEDGTSDNNIRYVGLNPNNYVLFNGEKWRIIGVMNNVKDNETDSVPKSKIKIIKSELSTNKLAWDSSEKNDWNESSLQEYLNGTYYEEISEDSQKLISSSLWNLSGIDAAHASYAPAEMYKRERGTDVYSGNKTTWTGNIGLMYPSDYGYATTGPDQCITSYNYYFDWKNHNECFGADWLLIKQREWTLTQSTSVNTNNITNVFIVYQDGSVSAVDTKNSEYYRPVIYLDTNVKIAKGTGKSDDPYILKS